MSQIDLPANETFSPQTELLLRFPINCALACRRASRTVWLPIQTRTTMRNSPHQPTPPIGRPAIEQPSGAETAPGLRRCARHREQSREKQAARFGCSFQKEQRAPDGIKQKCKQHVPRCCLRTEDEPDSNQYRPFQTRHLPRLWRVVYRAEKNEAKPGAPGAPTTRSSIPIWNSGTSQPGHISGEFSVAKQESGNARSTWPQQKQSPRNGRTWCPSFRRSA